MTFETHVSARPPGPSARGAVSMQVRGDGIAIVTYDVAGESVNTLKAGFAEEFENLLSEIEADSRIRAAVLLSGKADSFIAGADIEMLKATRTAKEAEEICRVGHRAVAHIAAAKKPMVAAIHGAALGGGFEVALACQARVLTDDKKTILAFPEVQLGLLPGMNGLQRLAQKAGLEVALDYGLNGKNMRPAKALELGIADDVVPRAILQQTAVDLALALSSSSDKPLPARRPSRARKKTSLSRELTRAALEKTPFGRAILFQKARTLTLARTHGHYPAPLAIIDVLKTFASRGFDASKEVEARAFGQLAASPVARNLMDLFFANSALKKDPGVDDPAILPRSVKQVFVLGAGLMGSGIAYVTSASASLHVRVKDRDDAALSKGLFAVTEILDDRVRKKQLSRIEKGQTLARLTSTTDNSGLHQADLIIEAVFENLALKQQVLREIEEHARPDAIFASNTSSIPITRIAAASRRPENVVGMHYFSPVHKMPLLEVIRTEKTDPRAVATAVATGKKQGKTVIVVADGAGFYTTRVLAPYLNEACFLLLEGLSVEAIDKALIAYGWPVGPLKLIDEVGLDVAAHVARIMFDAYGERVAPPPGVAKLVADGRHGRKNQKGFYLYANPAVGQGQAKQGDSTVYAALGVPAPAPRAKVSPEEIQMRCTLQFVNEAAHCFGDRILRSARDGDVGAVLGLGFPPFRGGPFRLVDELGPDEVVRQMSAYQERHGPRWAPAPVLVDMARDQRRFYG